MNRSFRQVSIRTVLILVGVVSAALALLAEKGRRHQRAIAAVERVHGEIQFAEATPLPWRLFHSSVKEIKVGWPHPDQALHDFAFLAELPEIEILTISDCPDFDDADLTFIARLKNLKRLSIVNCSISAPGLDVLKALPLERLRVGPFLEPNETGRISDEDLIHLLRPGLKELRLMFPQGLYLLLDEQEQLVKRLAPGCKVTYGQTTEIDWP